MQVAKLIENRRRRWQELESLCSEMSTKRRKMGAEKISRFAKLYRSACADLALADSYQLPPNIVDYLHKLVGRAHGQLYRSHSIDWRHIGELLMQRIPQQIFQDRCVQLAFVMFWTVFLLAGFMASQPSRFPDFAVNIAGSDAIDQMEEMYANDPGAGNGGPTASGAAFYINHNTGIGIQCFVLGITLIGGMCVLLFNAALLGTIFGHMASPSVSDEVSDHFFEFVTAHGPFELTAIVLAAGAGLRIGFALISPHYGEDKLESDELDPAQKGVFDHARRITFNRLDSLKIGARRALPVMGASAILFTLAAMVEAWVSPSPLPVIGKQIVAIFCSGLLMLYFIILGYPRRNRNAA